MCAIPIINMTKRGRKVGCMGTYVVGDIHGHFGEWISLKERIENLDPDAVFILVGDILDRGPDSLKMVRWAMEHITPNGKYRMVIGNHEDMKIEWWAKYRRNRCENEPYNFHKYLINGEVSVPEIEEMIAFFESLPIVIEMDVQTTSKMQHYIIAHAAMSSDFLTEEGYFRDEMLEYSSWMKYGGEETGISPRKHILWNRNFWGNLWKQDAIFVHGHTPTSLRDLVVRGAVPGWIDYKEKDINVDCGVYIYDWNRNFAAIRLEDLEEFYLLEQKEVEEHLLKKRAFSKERLLKMISEE